MKKKKYFSIKLTNPKGQTASLRLPQKYRTYFDKALAHTEGYEYDQF